MKIARTGWMTCLGAALAACGGGGEPGAAETASADAAVEAEGGAAPRPRPSRTQAASSVPPVPTAEDSAAAVREDVSPEWKMNQRHMAPYADCMAQANSVPEPARARLAAACRNLPDAPK